MPEDLGLDVIKTLLEQHLKLCPLLHHFSLLLPQSLHGASFSLTHTLELLRRFTVIHLSFELLVVSLLHPLLVNLLLGEASPARLLWFAHRGKICGCCTLLAGGLSFHACNFFPGQYKFSQQGLSVVFTCPQFFLQLLVFSSELLVLLVKGLGKLLCLVELGNHTAVMSLELRGMLTFSTSLCFQVLGHLLKASTKSTHQVLLLVLQDLGCVVLDALQARYNRLVHIADGIHPLTVLIAFCSICQTSL
mmetsp:Transcript_103061/g.183117  ORF Transcript_103061/g.183117 Transcript_103061/m.183117 type:complete len:248 (+) Transcript_103061:313-1056(+)